MKHRVYFVSNGELFSIRSKRLDVVHDCQLMLSFHLPCEQLPNSYDTCLRFV